MPASTLSSWARLVWEELNARQLDANAIFRQAGLNPAKLGNAVARFPVANMIELWRLAQEASGDDGFGVATGQRWNATTFHALGFAWLASNSLGEALHRMSRYGAFLNDGLLYSLTSEQIRYRFRIRRDPAQLPEQQFPRSDPSADAGVVALLKMCRQLLGEDFSPVEITCGHPPNGGAILLEQFARCPIRYDQDYLEMVFDRQDIERTLPSGNDELTQAHEQIILKHMADLQPDNLSTKVQLAILDQLPSGNVKEADIASQLGLSSRTLQRRLLEEGINFQGLLQTARQKLADQYIRDENLSISEIAYLLGFSEQANFTRAFKRWTGCSPTQFRQQELLAG
ncbi:AraC family transcriptional regulator [Ketobacter sp.]|uniref:AraC family transcriptional regulator n=1 Tax=Ketobacter sp. TaxID=2083498 RepID=UPI0025B7FB4D|nr:AraC family transcriptional regulator [Ketobacter sp.]